ncbi:MAG: hypothetical protein CMF26_06445 [Kiloniella sp.]|nr:hypothetical protein [Kiloniella sp.]
MIVARLRAKGKPLADHKSGSGYAGGTVGLVSTYRSLQCRRSRSVLCVASGLVPRRSSLLFSFFLFSSLFFSFLLISHPSLAVLFRPARYGCHAVAMRLPNASTEKSLQAPARVLC